MQLESLDHLVLTVRDIAATVAWYERVLGMQSVTFGEGRIALVFGSQKINLHTAGNEIAPPCRRADTRFGGPLLPDNGSACRS